VSTTSTILEQRTGKESAVEGWHLLVMTPALCSSHPLPGTGAMVIGRGKDADVIISDPLASRCHARLRLDGGALTIEDLGSANGTRLREEKLASHQPTQLLAGEAVCIGRTVLMVLQNRLRPAQRTLLSHEEFEGRVEWECTRAEATQARFCVLRLRLPAEWEPDAFAMKVAGTLRPMDQLGCYAPGQYEILLPGLPGDAALAFAGNLRRALSATDVEIDAGLACYPRDGRHASALLAFAGANLALPASRGDEHPRVAAAPGMQDVHALAERAAVGSINVLILGETGSGKEVLARYIHARSRRRAQAFVCVDCAALSASLLESELFGHEKGAFTGAATAKPGLLETAPGGTIFLDEVGEMPLPLQAKLLRAIENRQITRIGSVRPRPIDVRFLAATNRDLEAAVGAGSFRRDLYYRLNGMTLIVPPLRERVADIPLLARTLVADLCQAEKRPPPVISPQALASLCAYAWPGNVRELRNVMERALLLCTGRELTCEHLPEATLTRQLLAPTPDVDPGSERERILAALAACAGNQSRAARQLGLSRKVLIARLESYGVARPRKSPRR
jgi:two-component system response regulator AtoC